MAPGGGAEASETWPTSYAWVTANPASVGMNAAALNHALQTMSGNVVVIRNGYLVASRGDVGKKIDTYSVGKSLTSLVFGRALQKGKVTLDTLVPGSNYPQSPYGTYRHFLSMTSDYGLTPHAPGAHFAYNNQAYHRLGESLRPHFGNASPGNVLLNEFFSVMGRQDTFGFGGLWGGWGGGFGISARDLARFGLLVARDGRWKTQQLVPASFIASLYGSQIPGSAAPSYANGVLSDAEGPPGDNWWNQHDATDQLDGHYSFGWWTNANGRYPSLPQHSIIADGKYGNFLFVCPSKELVVAITFAGDGKDPNALLAPIVAAATNSTPPPPPGTISGELRRWHDVTITFDGPQTSEGASPNPFLDRRMDVTFQHGANTVVVPGYYAADGNAGNSGASSGGKWRVHFVPDEEGTWTYAVSFRSGTNVAVASNPLSGTPAAPDGATGSFTVGPTNKSGADFRGKGMLRYIGERYLRFAGNGEWFLKGGADSPENLLAFKDFDQTTPKHAYAPHAGDWKSGDPTWAGGRGKNLIGALNYLASQGMNSVYFITMTVAGDGNDVWPWTSSSERLRFDVSKLDQWQAVFDHMERVGLHMQVVMQETENDQLLDGGALGTTRKLYYRELIARFAHHLAMTWNLGEENTNTDAQRKEFATFIKTLDPYDHPLVCHTYPNDQTNVFTPLLGHAAFDGASIQVGAPNLAGGETDEWVRKADLAGRKWVVTLDEIGPADKGVLPDSHDPQHEAVRRDVLWASLMEGGAGVEWYFGYGYPNDDLDCEDWRSRQAMWAQTDAALSFFRQHVNYPHMTPEHDWVASPKPNARCLAQPGESYVLHAPAGDQLSVYLGSTTNVFDVRWYDPRNGTFNIGQVAEVGGPGWRWIGFPPYSPGSDWVALLTRKSQFLDEYGAGVKGYAGRIPTVSANDPRLGTPWFRVAVDHAAPSSPCLLLAGEHAAAIPLLGGLLLNDAGIAASPGFTNAAGHAEFGIPLPKNPAYNGLPLHFQWIVVDPAASQGASMTAGLKATLHM